MESDSLPVSGGDAIPALSPWILWAKWSRGKGIGSYHPVLCHLIDVAMATEALWRRALPGCWKERFASALNLEVAEAERCVVFWAGLHDLGKVCPGFQLQLYQANPIAHSLVVQRLRDAGLPWTQVEWIAHGAVSAKALREILPREYGYADELATAVAIAIGGHHGCFQSYGELKRLSVDGVGDARWHAARICYAAWLAGALGKMQKPGAVTMSHPTAMTLAGLVSVADWIGSSSFFTHAAPDASRIPSLDIQSYRDNARTRANTAVEALGWTGWTPSQTTLTFAQLFGIETPRPLQQATMELAAGLNGPAIVVLESPMGEGKTEAAMYLADHWSVLLGQRGIYFALPTQATSDSMFQRVKRFLAGRYPSDLVNLQLLHGHAALSETLKELHDNWRGLLTPNGIYSGKTSADNATGEVVAAEWFSDAKRSLLAPFGVGTVDQALLAALQIKHVFVRQFGLSTKTVIIDEVHAYDAYMSILLTRLLEWLGAFEVPVVLLSATLPRQRCEALLAAYAKGAGWSESTPRTIACYPRITWASATECDACPTEVSPLNRRTIQVEWLATNIPELGSGEHFALGERLKELLTDGGCAAIICNTVSRAQRVYEALKPYFPGNASDGEAVLDLLHARYPHEMRSGREARVLRRFGKPGEAVVRPDCAVVVATQVIEQSLDLDFDVMVTDLAPADLVLQRMGRLHRHKRPRPAGLEHPHIFILQSDDGEDGAPNFDRGSEAVYDAHILLRSYLALQEYPTLAMPDDIEPLVETVYDEALTCPLGTNIATQARWRETLADLQMTRENEQQEAKNRYIKHPRFGDELAAVVRAPREEDAPELHPALQALTRLAEPAVGIVCLAGTAEQPLLRPSGEPLNLKRKPPHEDVEALLRRSVTLSDKRVVRLLKDQQQPAHWNETPLLRNHRYLIFDEYGIASVGQWRIRLDPELGIVIE